MRDTRSPALILHESITVNRRKSFLLKRIGVLWFVCTQRCRTLRALTRSCGRSPIFEPLRQLDREICAGYGFAGIHLELDLVNTTSL